VGRATLVISSLMPNIILRRLCRPSAVAKAKDCVVLVGALTTEDGTWSRHKNFEIEPE
jgi:hypothetical protein